MSDDQHSDDDLFYWTFVSLVERLFALLAFGRASVYWWYLTALVRLTSTAEGA